MGDYLQGLGNRSPSTITRLISTCLLVSCHFLSRLLSRLLPFPKPSKPLLLFQVWSLAVRSLTRPVSLSQQPLSPPW
jgi:hypothetical protein